MIKYRAITVINICLILFLSNFTLVVSAENPINNHIYAQPESSTVQLGSLFDVVIYLDLHEDVSGWSIEELTFPPDLLTVENVVEGELFDGLSSSFAILGKIDNITGKITDMVCFTPFGDSVSNSGSLCVITFYSKKAGSAEINFSATLSYAGNDVPHEEHNVTIEIQGGRDTIPPVIEDVSADPNPQYNDNYVNITCNVIDDIAVDNVNAVINGPSGFTPVNVSMSCMQGTNKYYYDESYSITGTYSFQIWANDTSNNQNESSTYNFEIVENQNQSPVANNEHYTINEDTILTIAAPGILINDTDAEEDPLTAIKVTDPAYGTLSEFNSDGSFTYIPNSNFCGSDSFTYKANDGFSDSNIATVHITVNCINDPPAADFTYSPDNPTVSDTISFTDMSNNIDGNVVNWTWNFGDGNISYLQNPQHKYSLGGKYDVKLTVRDNNSAKNNITKKLTIKNPVVQNITVNIIRPINCIYIFDTPSKKNIMNPFIIGKITIRVDVKNAVGATTIEYYIDGEYKANNTRQPYEWLWNERAFGKHTIKVIANDSRGKTDSDLIELRIYNFGIFKNRLSNFSEKS